ncbi:MAG: hypothetical protein JWN66_4788 [Sphingomonas bacterium]|uniref:Rossmann fold domain-containing protein n=1 Tax=Sphingomonas bacterium TaxID=1895847 RepID=UPI002605B194|nr:hypothetical protein [Sphingomonas bacterium]MDB5707672.1 hypothetical protein [Sphingomonas bacterium]
MTWESAVRDILADVDAAPVFARPDATVEEIVRRLRQPAAAIMLLLIDPLVPAVDRAMLLAAIGPLATELAPGTRIAAIDIASGAASADIAAAAHFLAKAQSTTGQVLRVEAES